MRRALFTAVMLPLFVLGVGLMAAEQGKDKGKPAKKSPLEGTWTAAKGEGKVMLTFSGDKFTVTKSRGEKTEDITGTFKLDTKVTPQAIDMTVTGGNAKELEKYKGKTSLGIVKLDGNKLEWCANEPGKDTRPTMFTEKEGEMGFLYVVFERAGKTDEAQKDKKDKK
jgi:uncharacterized protein (TIGR03067 family)